MDFLQPLKLNAMILNPALNPKRLRHPLDSIDLPGTQGMIPKSPKGSLKLQYMGPELFRF